MTKTQYFTAPADRIALDRIVTHDNGAFVSVTAYISKSNCEPLWTRHFAAGDTTPTALFAARSEAAKYVAEATVGYTELTGPGSKTGNMEW